MDGNHRPGFFPLAGQVRLFLFVEGATAFRPSPVIEGILPRRSFRGTHGRAPAQRWAFDNLYYPVHRPVKQFDSLTGMNEESHYRYSTLSAWVSFITDVRQRLAPVALAPEAIYWPRPGPGPEPRFLTPTSYPAAIVATACRKKKREKLQPLSVLVAKHSHFLSPVSAVLFPAKSTIFHCQSTAATTTWTIAAH